jgi:hypothetical protein
VPHKHKSSPRVFNHAGGDFAGESALKVVVHVLRTNGNGRSFGGLGHGGQGGKGRANQDVAVFDGLNLRRQLFDEVHTLGNGFEHFPVSGHQGTT